MINFNQFYQRIYKSRSVSHRPKSAFVSIYPTKKTQDHSQTLLQSHHTEKNYQKNRKRQQNLRSTAQSQNYSVKRQKKSIKSSPNKEKYKYQVLNFHCLKRLSIQNRINPIGELFHNKQFKVTDVEKKKEDRARQKEFMGKKFKCVINRANRIRTQPLDQNQISFAISGFKIV